MRGRVTASRLNVRLLPSLSAKKIGILPRDTVVSVLTQYDDWLEIRHNAMSAYVSGEFVQLIEGDISMRAKVTVPRLNVRAEPRLNAVTLGTLMWDAQVDILDETGEWLEIAFNERSAFIQQNYVQIFESRQDDFAEVADRLNVRAGPGTVFTVLGILERGEKIKIVSRIGIWCEISFNGAKAYVLSDFLTHRAAGESRSALVVSPADTQENIVAQSELAPQEKLPLTGDIISKKAAQTWNKFGGILETLSGAYNIDPGVAVAVFCVESSGKGFEPKNDNRLIIRFENHLFWKYWGKKNPQKFHQHFKYGLRENNRMKVWKGHFWRPESVDNWQEFHGNQTKEWDVLTFARRFADTEALYCISMGAPQIMGFNYQIVGYDSVEEMFEKFNLDIRYHIEGFFDFLDKRMIKALQRRDFTEFAGYYNGSGQKQTYGNRIQNYFDAYQELIS